MINRQVVFSGDKNDSKTSRVLGGKLSLLPFIVPLVNLCLSWLLLMDAFKNLKTPLLSSPETKTVVSIFECYLYGFVLEYHGVTRCFCIRNDGQKSPQTINS